jgi:hypothetical protein
VDHPASVAWAESTRAGSAAGGALTSGSSPQRTSRPLAPGIAARMAQLQQQQSKEEQQGPTSEAAAADNPQAAQAVVEQPPPAPHTDPEAAPAEEEEAHGPAAGR